MRNTINILGVNFDNVTMDEAVKIGIGLFEEEGKHSVYTPNPEIVMAAYDNLELQKQLNEGSLVIPDGIGVVIGSRIIRKPLKERVAGYDFTRLLFNVLKDTEKRIFFYGSKPGVAELAAKKIRQEFIGIKIVGICDGYEQNQEKIINSINEANPDLVLVGLGAPRQEAWISNNMEKVKGKVFIGVGGSFDGFSGTVKRSPDIFIKLNIEWLHRLVTQPSRIFRMLKLPQFIIKMFIEGKKYK
jgi:N-acetylglucosaminyldiphosphoundecaprenol N-acetyl-beta-D-mannosaminyltransferase